MAPEETADLEVAFVCKDTGPLVTMLEIQVGQKPWHICLWSWLHLEQENLSKHLSPHPQLPN